MACFQKMHFFGVFKNFNNSSDEWPGFLFMVHVQTKRIELTKKITKWTLGSTDKNLQPPFGCTLFRTLGVPYFEQYNEVPDWVVLYY